MTSAIHSLTSAARGIWLGQVLNPTCRAYWTAEYLELRGRLDTNALRAAIDLTFREAHTLHQRVFQEAEQVLALLQVPDQIELAQIELNEADALALLNAELPPAPNLRDDALFALQLIRVDDTLHFLELRVHHLALDGTGYGLLYRRLFQCYSLFQRGITPAFEPRPMQPLVVEENEYANSPAFALDKAHYARLLRDAQEPSVLAPLRPLGPRPRVRRSHLAADDLERGLSRLKELRLEPVAFLLATLGCWLEEKTGESQHVLGLAVAGRFSAHALRSPSMSMNIVPVRVDVPPNATLAELARSVQEQLRDGRRHQRYRYENLRTDRAASGVTRPFGIVLNYMPFEPPPSVEGLNVTRRPLAAGPVEDLAFSIAAEPAGWRCDIEAHSDAYADSALAALETSWRTRLDASLSDPCQSIADLFGAKKALSRLVNNEPAEAIDVLARLERFAIQQPGAHAIESDEAPSLDYSQLLHEVRCCAGALAQRGVRSGDRVALLLRRSPSSIVAQLAVLWLGGAYVPIDPDGPQERLVRVLDDAKPSLLVADAADIVKLKLSEWSWMPATERGDYVERMAFNSSQAAYLIFTSGTTGTPNGVVIGRGALAHFTAAALQRYGLHASDRVLQFSPLQFDASVEEIHTTFASGATLVLRADDMLDSLARFALSCERLEVSVLDLPTAYWHELVDAPGQLANLSRVRLWIIGGEAAHPQKVLRHFQRFGESAQLINSYGPTETTVVCATAQLHANATSEPIPIGVPLPGIELLVLDAQSTIVEQGRPGQLAVLGPTLATGYFEREELTSTRFITLTVANETKRAYLTGDRVRVNEQAELVYLGRLDDELKLSGHRVQPLEVELALSHVAGIAECAVVVAQTRGARRLAAYYVAQDPSPSAETLRTALRARVHPAAIPAHFQQLERLPRDSNGKVDRSSLRKLVPQSVQTSGTLSELEQTVAAAFHAVLGRAVASADDDFFALGGHSLSALQLASRLTRSCGFDIPISSVFEHTTVRGLARALATGPRPGDASADPLAPYVILREGHDATVFCVHPADGLAYCYWGLGAHWPGVRLVGLQPWALRHPQIASGTSSIERHAQLIEQLVPNGPVHLLGYSSGGGLALELAVLLGARGRDVRTLAMLDSFPADVWQGTPAPTLHDALVSMLDDLDATARDDKGALVSLESLYERLSAAGSTLASFDHATLSLMAHVALDGMLGYRALRHATWSGELTYFAATQGGTERTTWRAWLPYLVEVPQVIEVPTFHLGMTQPPILERVAKTLWPRLQNSQ